MLDREGKIITESGRKTNGKQKREESVTRTKRRNSQ